MARFRSAGRYSPRAHAFALGLDRQRVVGEIAAHHLGQPRQPRRRRIRQQIGRRGAERSDGARIVGQREGDLRMGHGQALDDVGGVIQFGRAPPSGI